MRRARLLFLSAIGLSALALPSGASAGGGSLPTVERGLVAKRTLASDCHARARRGARGIATTTWRAPMSGFVTVRLSGARRADWDLALFDAASRRRLASSEGFGSREVAQTWVTSGQRLLVQGCRKRGRARRARATAAIKFLDVAPPERSTPSLVRVKRPSDLVLHTLETKGFDVTHNMRSAYADVVVPDGDKLGLLKDLGIPYETRIADLNAYYAKSRRADARFAASAARSPLPTGREGYRKLEDYQSELKQLADPAGPYADIVKPVVIGHSFQGRELQGVEISHDVHRGDDGKPVYFLMALHHAREWPSAEIAMEFAWMLAKGYGDDPEITELLKKQRVVVVPLINPDGFFASRSAASDGMFPDPADTTGAPEADTVEGVVLPFGGNLAYRRKNCNGPVPSLGGSERDYPCYYQWGVDPNRNYGEGWGGPGASPDPNTQVYRGDGQWSEPETQAVHEFSQTRPVTNLITLHNVAALVLRPPGRSTGGKAPDEFRMRAIGNAMADVTGYTSQYGFQLYDTSGGTEDWNYAAAGTYGYTIEIGPVNGQFHMPYETGVVNEWLGPPADPANPDGPRKGGLREALLMQARSAATPGDHSVLTGSAKGGTTLRLHKDFTTKSSPVCTFAQGYVRAGTVPALDCIAPGAVREAPDSLDYTLSVPKNGKFEWHVTPSTRPFVGSRFVEGEKVESTDTFTGAGPGQPPASGERVEKTFEVTAADVASELDLKLDWTAKPEDYNLYLSYVEADGSRTPIGTGWFVDNAIYWTAPGTGVNPNGLPEHITLDNPPVGTYVAEIENNGGVVNDWTLTVRRSGQHEGHVEPTGQTEAYRLTCEDEDGTVLSERAVTVARGESLDLGDVCGAKKRR